MQMNEGSQNCFVLMPFGKKPSPRGGPKIDFDELYEEAIRPAIVQAGLLPHRDDDLAHGGHTNRGIFEALILAEFAIADLTLVNGNVFYELGIRHAVRPASTLTITAFPDQVPFDAAGLRTVRYHLSKSNALSRSARDTLQAQIENELRELRTAVTTTPDYADSPLYQMVEGWHPEPVTGSIKTDVFRRYVEYNNGRKRSLERLRRRAQTDRSDAALKAVHDFQRELGDLAGVEAGVLVDLLLTFRALEAPRAMLDLVESMPGYVSSRTLVQEQAAFALTRLGSDGDLQDATRLLEQIIAEGRGSSETYGLLGRVHKQRWRDATSSGERRAHLEASISAYHRGMIEDPSDPYPAMNAATLTFVRRKGMTASVRDMIAVVRMATKHSMTKESATYWMWASLAECSVLRLQFDKAERFFARALDITSEQWEPKTTLLNLQDIASVISDPKHLRRIDRLKLALEEHYERLTREAASASTPHL